MLSEVDRGLLRGRRPGGLERLVFLLDLVQADALLDGFFVVLLQRFDFRFEPGDVGLKRHLFGF